MSQIFFSGSKGGFDKKIKKQKKYREKNPGKKAFKTKRLSFQSRPSASQSDAENVIRLSDETLRYINEQASESALVSTTISQVVSQVMSGGVSIKIMDKTGTWEPNRRLREYVETGLKPFMYESMGTSFVSGVIVWSLTPYTGPDGKWQNPTRKRKRDDGFGSRMLMLPVVARAGHYQIGMRFDGDVRTYEVYRPTKLSNASVGGSPIFDNNPDPYTWVTPIAEWAPTSDGMLHSPVCLAMEAIIKLKEMWKIYTDSMINFTKPLLVWDVSESGSFKNVNPIETGLVSTEDIGNIHREHIKRQNDEAQADLDAARMFAHFKNRGYGIVQFNTNTQLPSVKSSSPMYENSYLSPLGQHLAQTVTPSQIPNFPEAIQSLTNTVIEALCTPSNSRTFTTQTHTATADFMFKMYNERVKMLQEQFGVAFSRIVKKAFSSIVEEGLQEDFFEIFEEDSTKTNEFAKQGSELADFEDDEFEVEVTFSYTPLTTFETLKNLYDAGIMSHNTMGKYGVRLYGFADEDQMSEKELMKDLKLRKRMAEAMMTDAEKSKLEGAKQGAGNPASSNAASGAGSKSTEKKTETKSSVTGEPSLKKKKTGGSASGSDPKK